MCDTMNLKEKTVLISGATGGMGEALAKQCAREGCNIALFARREEQLKALCSKLAKQTSCVHKKCDVTNPRDVKSAVSFTQKKFGRIDIALLSAGILIPNPIETLTSSIITKSMEINFFGNVYFIEYLVPIMKKQSAGTIAAVSTLPDRRGIPGWGAYGASKAALSCLMESLRAEGKQKYNINFITIKPGSVETPMIEEYHRAGAISPEKAAAIIIKGIKKGKKVIQFPLSQVMMIRLGDLFPVAAYDMIPVEMQKGDGFPNPEK